MPTYEAALLLLPSLEEASMQSLTEKFSSQVVEAGGAVAKVDRQGKRRLAYPVRKEREGYFVVMEFSGGSQVAKGLDRILQLSNEVLRSVIMRLN